MPTKQLRRGKGDKASLIALAFVLPAFIFHLCVVALPSISTLFYSFFEWNGLGNAKFIGLSNYIELFTKDRIIWTAVKNNLIWLSVFITVPVISGLIISFLLTKIKRGQMLLRTIFFMPYVVSAVIAGKIWTALYNPYFGVNTIFAKMGLTELSKVEWLGNTKIALFSVAAADNWHFWGFVMVLFMSALHQVDSELYEAATIDGCNKTQEFLYITIPGIRPTLVFIMLMIIIWSFLTFDYVWVMTMGGPAQATEILSTWMYKNAFIQYRAGYANAICVVQSFICIFVYMFFEFLKRKGLDV